LKEVEKQISTLQQQQWRRIQTRTEEESCKKSEILFPKSSLIKVWNCSSCFYLAVIICGNI